MPYIRKDALRLLLRDSFMSGFISGLSLDHVEESESQKREADFEQYYKELQKKK